MKSPRSLFSSFFSSALASTLVLSPIVQKGYATESSQPTANIPAIQKAAVHLYSDAQKQFRESGNNAFIKALGFESKEDQKYFSARFAQYGAPILPALEQTQDQMVFKYQGKSVVWEVVDYYQKKVRVNGTDYTFKAGKTLKDTYQLNGEALLKLCGGEEQNALWRSFENSLTPEAHAGAGTWLGISGLIAFLGVPLMSSIFDKSEGSVFNKMATRYQAFGTGAKDLVDGGGSKGLHNTVKALGGKGEYFEEEQAKKKGH